MKKKIAIVLILILISTASFYTLFYIENQNSLNVINNAEKTEESFQMIVYSGELSKDQVYIVLKTLLEKYQGNIFLTKIIRYSGRIGYAKYIYLTDWHYFENFKLVQGRFWDFEEIGSDKFLSTIEIGDIKQIGQIADFAGDDLFEIHTLKSMPGGSTAYDGDAILQLNNPHDIDSFINDLNQAGIVCKQREILHNSDSIYSYLIYIIMIILYLLLVLLIFYDILSSYKKIGIEKMFGFKMGTIWLYRILPIMAWQFVIFTIIPLIFVPFLIKEYNEFFYIFLSKLIIQNCLLFVLTFLSVSLPFLYACRITISDIIKNKRPVKAIIIMNTIIKLVLSVITVSIVLFISTQYSIVYSHYINSFKIWEATKEYAIIPSIRDIPSENFLHTDSFREAQKELYMYFNKKGSILADFYIYWPLMRERVVNEHPVDYERDKVEVNPNYLKVNPIYDIKGERINIDESETDYILLVPEQYMTYETKIMEYYNNLANGYDKKPETPDQKIKILWIKEDQKLFTYRIDINPISGNRVKNAIIRVITESNGKIRDYDRIIAYSGNPFKIKVDDPLNPSASIRSKLREYGLSQYIADIPSVYDYVASEVKTITDRLLFLSVILLLTCGIIVLIIVHNIYNYFEQYKVRLAIQQFHGYRKRDRYKPYFSLVIAGWFFVSIITGLINSAGITRVIILNAGCMLFEIIISFLAIGFVEKRKLTAVTKGG